MVYSPWCASCRRQYRKDYCKLYPEKVAAQKRRGQLKFKYDLTQEEYDKKFEEQNGCCAICHKPEQAIDYRTGKVRRLAVDHNHETGEVRGLLCSICNPPLHLVEYTPEWFAQALNYLKQWGHE